MVDRLSSCTNDRDAVSTTLRVVPALQIDCAAKKRAWNRPRGSIRSAPRCTRTVRSSPPSPALFNRRECKRCNLSPDLFRVFSSFLFLFLFLFPNDGRSIVCARVCVKKTRLSRPRTVGSPFFEREFFPDTRVFNRVSRTELVRKHSSARGRTRLNAKFPPLPV